MTLVAEFATALRAESLARLRCAIVLRAMAASGVTQAAMAKQLGVTQPAVSQQLRTAEGVVERAHPHDLIEAGGSTLALVAAERGFSRLAVFGSVARGDARSGSDIDLIVQPPPDAGLRELASLRALFARILARPVDLVTYGGLKPGSDDDILEEAVEL